MKQNKTVSNNKLQPEHRIWFDLSVIIPVYNSGQDLIDCVKALQTSAHDYKVEIIVVDDASTDDTVRIAERLGVQVVPLEKNGGQSTARNRGVEYAQSNLLFFVDADVVVAPDAIEKVMGFFNRHPDIAALFGSYDANPRARETVSQYKNLSHHFIHQKGKKESSTFWSGCGAIQRDILIEVGGFNEDVHNYGHMEDVELGYRLRRAGHRIRLDPTLQGTHLKKWTLRSMVRTDVVCRAIPWSKLILENRDFPNDLNIEWKQRYSVVLTFIMLLSLLFSVVQPAFLFVSGIATGGVIALNYDLFRFFIQQRGIGFALACIPLHLLYYVYSGLSFMFVVLQHRLRSITSHSSVGRPPSGPPDEVKKTATTKRIKETVS